MALELPGEVVQLLQFIGVNWPNINEDKVREAGQHVKQFAENLQSTHQEASAHLQQAGQHYQGSGYEAMLAAWGQKSDDHMNELVEACHVVSMALDAGADVIIGMKGAAIAELVALAASFLADQAAAVATFGLAEAALALIEEAAKKCVSFLEQQLIQYIIAQIIGAAIQPLIGTIDKAIDGLVYSALSSALGVPAPAGGGGGGGGAMFQMDTEAFTSHMQGMQQHADAMMQHAQVLHGNLSGMSFS
ncbi:MAG TPA: hypothetical protein VFU73_01600 [Actinocrinis sp.]|nr:hypothetical protein [Actinocrinis sp.]